MEKIVYDYAAGKVSLGCWTTWFRT